MATKKLVVIGDKNCGKTSMIRVLTNGSFKGNLSPIDVQGGVDCYTKLMTVGETQINLVIWDTAGNDGNNRLRTQSYPGADVVLMTLALDSPDALMTIQRMWQVELQKYCSGIPIVLVGAKRDLRDDPETISRLANNNQIPISFGAGVKMASRMKACAYLECSAKTSEGVHEVFQFATRAIMGGISETATKPSPPVSKPGCNLL